MATTLDFVAEMEKLVALKKKEGITVEPYNQLLHIAKWMAEPVRANQPPEPQLRDLMRAAEAVHVELKDEKFLRKQDFPNFNQRWENLNKLEAKLLTQIKTVVDQNIVPLPKVTPQTPTPNNTNNQENQNTKTAAERKWEAVKRGPQPSNKNKDLDDPNDLEKDDPVDTPIEVQVQDLWSKRAGALKSVDRDGVSNSKDPETGSDLNPDAAPAEVQSKDSRLSLKEFRDEAASLRAEYDEEVEMEIEAEATRSFE